MANNYYDATGVLILDRVTPIITALFTGLNLDKSYPGNGTAYIARISETDNPQWNDVLSELTNLATSLSLALPSDEDLSLEVVLEALATYFGAEQNEDLERLIEQQSFADFVDLEALFLIATCFNDGHNLVAIQFEGCWRCDRPRLFEFGGDGCFISQEIRLFNTSSHALLLGEQLRSAILGNATEEASNLIVQETLNLLCGIKDERLRANLQQQIAKQLLPHLLE